MGTTAAPISSVSDMMSSVPADLFDSIVAPEDTSTEEISAEPVDNAIEVADPDEDASGEASEISEPAEAAEPADADTKPAEGDKPAATEDELPEGVRKGQDRKGKAGYFLEENRYQTFHGNHKLVQEGSAIIGEPLTADALRLRNEAYLGQERLFTNLTSGDPALQSDVLKFIITEMQGARQNGEVGVDPSVPFAESVYQTLRSQSPAAYEHLRLQAARDLTEEMYDQAARTGDVNLFSSAQRFVAALANVEPKPAGWTDEQYAEYIRERAADKGFSFHTVSEIQDLVKAEDPLAARDKRIAELESTLSGRSRNGAAEQYAAWSRSNITDVNKAILDDAVKPSLALVEGGWKDFPDDYKRLVTDPLHREVIAAIKADPGLDQMIRDLQARAQRATSEQVRAQLGQQIKALFVNRAKQAAEAKKTPIVKFAADWLKGRSDQSHERRNNAQTRTAPKGPGAPTKPSLLPNDVGFKDGIFDPTTAVKQMQALLR